MLDYILKVLLFQTLFLAVYDLFLKRETFFQWNRAYLLLTSLMAYLLPFVNIKRVQRIVPDSYQVYLDEMPEMVLSPSILIRDQFNWPDILLFGTKAIFILGALVAGALFVFRLSKIFKLINQSKIEKKAKFYLVWLKESEAYSFFNYIFLGKQMTESSRKQVIAHEMVHVRQVHSLDLLFFEAQKVLAWFNPFSYWYQNRVAELHEFIADEEAVKHENKASYFNHLLVQSFGVADVSFINPFIKPSLIKKRIIMLNKNKSNQLRKLKYLLLIPVLGGILLYTSCTTAQTTTTTKKEVKKVKNVALDEIVLGKHFGMSAGVAMKGKKISFENLTADEKLEYKSWTASTLKRIPNSKFEIWQYKNEKKIINHIIVGGIVKKKPQNGDSGRDVPFAIIEEAPIHPDCDSTNPQELRKCLQEQIQKHVNKKYNVGLAGNLGLEPGRKRVHVQFLIDKNGEVKEVRSRGPHAVLEEEAIRVVNLLPKMKPGKQRGKAVGVKYTLPITLQVTGDTKQGNLEKAQKEYENIIALKKDLINSETIDQGPIHPDCTSGTKEEMEDCTDMQIKRHVNKKYKTGLAADLGLEPGRKKIHIQYVIDKNGAIADVKARGPHEALEKEAIRVIRTLPKMKPGEHQGKIVDVRKSLSVTLQVGGVNKVDQKKMIDELRVAGPQAYPMGDGTEKEYFSGIISTIIEDDIKKLPGVNIHVKGTDRKTESDFNGTFKIKLKKGETLVFKFIGIPDFEYEFKEGHGATILMF